VGVNHGGADVVVPQQLLHSTDVVAVLKQVRCERMTPQPDFYTTFPPNALTSLKDDIATRRMPTYKPAFFIPTSRRRHLSMPAILRSPTFSAIAVLSASLCVAGVAFFWLWREYTLYAIALSVVLLMGGATMLPSRNVHTHAASLGFCIGAFVAGALGAAGLGG
jgi:hypothetical protein